MPPGTKEKSVANLQGSNCIFRFLLGEEVVTAVREGDRVKATLASGKRLQCDCLLYTVGRQGNTGKLGLDKVGLEVNNRGLLTVNENYQSKASTNQPLSSASPRLHGGCTLDPHIYLAKVFFNMS